MLGTWRRVAFVARREIDAAMNEPPRTLGERERLARLIASLTRSLGRVRVEIDGEEERIEGLRVRREVEAKMTALYGPRR